MIQGYDLAHPTAADLQRSLATIIGEADGKAALSLALRDIQAGKQLPEELPPARLLELALALARQRGLPSVIGRSFAIRLSTYIELRESEVGHARD